MTRLAENTLAGRKLVPGLIQSDCTPDKLAAAVVGLFRLPAQRDALARKFERMYLHADAGGAATTANAIDQRTTRPDIVGQRS
jgi:lipid-A-disaccharide synthase